jgi:lactate dehydrogenase-like 2-hydroxyacid dehydrogenase
MRILFLNHANPEDVYSRFADADTRIEIRPGPIADPADVLSPATCRAADAIVNGSAVHDLGPVEPFSNCRIVVRMGVGYDNLDLAAWGARGVPVCNVPDYGTSEVADHAIALMLSLARGTSTYIPAIEADPVGGWKWGAAPLVRRLRGAVFGVIGLGRIGLSAAFRARGFGMEIAFYDPYLPNGVELAVGARRVHSAGDLVAISDVVSLHAPLTDETRGIIGRETLARAKPDLIVVNTARGPLVDLDALYDALQQRRIGGAALDVLPQEPPDPGQKLIRALHERADFLRGRLVITPHAAFYSPAAIEDIRRKTVEVVLHYLRDGRLTNCVNGEFLRRANA